MNAETPRNQLAADPLPLSVEAVLEAHAALKEHLFETPLLPSPDLSELSGATVLLKAENIQRAGSFKVRGSVNKLRKLAQLERVVEVTAASAGNHAQGVAYAASRFGFRSTIFMPEEAPLAKRRASERLGAQVRIAGRNYDESRSAALAYARDRGVPFIDGFDDWDIIEGQATVGHEIFHDLGDRVPDVVLVPAGGGGLLAGVLYYLRTVYGERTRVIGVQCDRAPGLAESLRLARQSGSSSEELLPLEVATRPTIADGIRIGRPGHRPFRVIRRWVDDVICVGEESIYEAIVYLYEHSRLVVEGAGAVGVAALLERRLRLAPDTTAVVVISGGNIDVGAMQKITTSHLYKSRRRAVLRIKVRDLPGQLARIVHIFDRLRINVAEIQQPPILGRPPSPEYTVFDICVETEGETHIPDIVQALEDERTRMHEEGVEPFQILDR